MKNIKTYSMKQITNIVTKIIKLYRKQHNNDHIFVYYNNLFAISLKKSKYKSIEKKYYKMCLYQQDEVWDVVCQLGIVVIDIDALKDVSSIHMFAWERIKTAIKYVEIDGKFIK